MPTSYASSHPKLEELRVKASNTIHSLQMTLSAIQVSAEINPNNLDAVQLHADIHALLQTVGTTGFDTQQFMHFTPFAPFQDHAEWWLSFTRAVQCAYTDTGDIQYGILSVKVGDEWRFPQPHVVFYDVEEDPMQKEEFLAKVNSAYAPYYDSLARIHAYRLHSLFQKDLSELSGSEKDRYLQCANSWDSSIAWIMQNKPLLPFDKSTVKWVKYPNFCALLQELNKLGG